MFPSGARNKIDRNTANWRQAHNLPNWHNVNIAQSFREPATYYLQSYQPADLDATYNDFGWCASFMGRCRGDVWRPTRMRGTAMTIRDRLWKRCGMVEQITSDNFLLAGRGT